MHKSRFSTSILILLFYLFSTSIFISIEQQRQELDTSTIVQVCRCN